MRCECTMPKEPDGIERCNNEAEFDVRLTPDYGSEDCYWCSLCCSMGVDMISQKHSLNPAVMDCSNRNSSEYHERREE